jgi:multiple sugar transport system permease protein
MVSTSVRGEGTILLRPADLWPSDPTLVNYREVLASGPMARYFLNSVLVAAIVVGGNLLFAPWVAMVLARIPFRGRPLVIASVTATLMVPKQVTMVPLYLMMVRVGLIDTYAALALPFMVDAFSVFLLTQYLRSVPRSLDEAARVDGASDWGVLFRVLMPLMRPALAVVAINTFLTNWNSFLYPLILTNRDQMRTLPVGLALYSQGPHSVDWGHLMAGATMAALPTLVVFLIFQRQIVSAMTRGALKG